MIIFGKVFHAGMECGFRAHISCTCVVLVDCRCINWNTKFRFLVGADVAIVLYLASVKDIATVGFILQDHQIASGPK